jgi:hypothetical protein
MLFSGQQGLVNPTPTALLSVRGRTVMTGKVDEPSTTNGLQYPMVNLFTGGTILPLMFVNVAATCYLLSLTAPLAFMEAWTKALENPTSRPHGS